MTEQSELLKEFQETKDKYEKLISKKGKLLLTEMFKAIFDACPEIKKITWDQYAPHFNDGDPCTFDVHERRFFVEGGECPEDDKYEWAEAPNDMSSSYFKTYIAPKWGKVTPAVIKKVAKLDEKLGALGNDIFESTFGESAEVTVTLNKKGEVKFTVEYCEHD
jgi:hypothetical protein